ncbi:MAG: hypothetical protein JSS29_06555 [Proteobacteria bacterium]|nr:hypothetical protein [Pseudomonadota bacterium]
MKLALLTPAAKREGLRERMRRSRAAAPALREAFPVVQQLRLDFLFQGSGPSTPAMQSHTLHAAARAFFAFPCPYADCDGEFDLNGAVRSALAHASHQATGEIECSGKRSARHGVIAPCRLRLDYAVSAALQPQT